MTTQVEKLSIQETKDLIINNLQTLTNDYLYYLGWWRDEHEFSLQLVRTRDRVDAEVCEIYYSTDDAKEPVGVWVDFDERDQNEFVRENIMAETQITAEMYDDLQSIRNESMVETQITPEMKKRIDHRMEVLGDEYIIEHVVRRQINDGTIAEKIIRKYSDQKGKYSPILVAYLETILREK